MYRISGVDEIDEYPTARRMPFQTSKSHMQQALAFYTLHMKSTEVKGGLHSADENSKLVAHQ